jgi:predicted nucleic acid-binding Zn ribbon protein
MTAQQNSLAKSEGRSAPLLLYNQGSDAMQHASSTLKKIFADTLRREAGDDAALLAWPLACGAKVAEKTSASSYANGVLTVEVPDATWQQQLQGFERQYLAALRSISGQPVSAIKFVVRNQNERAAR